MFTSRTYFGQALVWHGGDPGRDSREEATVLLSEATWGILLLTRSNGCLAPQDAFNALLSHLLRH